MIPNGRYLHLLVWTEQHKDQLREAERKRLIRTARGRPSRKWRPQHAVASWMGAQSVRWGQKLQDYDSVDWSQLAGDHSGSAGSECPGGMRHVQPQ